MEALLSRRELLKLGGRGEDPLGFESHLTLSFRMMTHLSCTR